MLVPGTISPMLLGGVSPASVVNTASPSSPASAPVSPYSVVGVSIGAASPDRYIIVAMTTVSGANIPITGVTVDSGGGAVSCTLLARCPSSVLGDCCLWITNAPISTGTTATISATYGTTPTYISMEVFAATGLISTTPTATISVGDGTSTAAAVALGTVTVNPGGFFLGYVSGWSNVAANFTWSGTLGATEATDNNPEGNNDIRQTSAILNSNTGVAGSVTATMSVAFVAGRRGGAGVCMR